MQIVNTFTTLHISSTIKNTKSTRKKKLNKEEKKQTNTQITPICSQHVKRTISKATEFKQQEKLIKYLQLITINNNNNITLHTKKTISRRTERMTELLLTHICLHSITTNSHTITNSLTIYTRQMKATKQQQQTHTPQQTQILLLLNK